MKFIIHGTRGSAPNANENFLKYGGNTSCFEISTENQQIFYDAGTGFISADLLRKTKDIFIFFSHFHHDHIQGLPFNSSLFKEGKNIVLTSALINQTEVRETLQKYFSGSYFPVDIFEILNHLTVQSFESTLEKIKDEVIVDFIRLNHPGGAVGYKFSSKKKKVVILLDNEFYDQQENELTSFCRDADLVVWDAMFTEDELKHKRGWGHSSIEQAEKFSLKANINKLVLCHHAPDRSDHHIDCLSKTISSSRVVFGFEKMSITL
jgi:phosphoribosyl 1,2-cyclic phosphodiesterase